ncbi:sensor histidine kinase [Microbacterium halophytorum]|uniref:sensor histidine kinase n=1 Tax=Microbacterium halophytorum TaxID=2067568 RepID=UPI001E615F76|nr:histidine kinase [Microbacterium halophytorum]
MRKTLFRRITRGQLAFDIVLAALFVPFFSLGIVGDLFVGGAAYSPAVQAWGVAITVVFGVALAFRRLSPVLALAIAWLGAIAQMAVGMSPQFFDVAVFFVLYATAAYGTTVVMWVGCGSAVAGALVAAVYMGIQYAVYSPVLSPLDWGVTVGMWFAMVAFALLLSWTTGALVRAARQARANREARERAELLAAGEQERGRIARDMHDVVAHSLAVVVAQADGARYAADADPALAKEALGTISSTARAALVDVRQLLAQLRHSQAAGPQPRLADLEGLFAGVRAAGVELSVDTDPTPPGEPPTGVQLAVFRILQEALTNALRHGGGSAVDVRMAWRPGRVVIEVRNAVGDDRAHAQGRAPGGAGPRGHGIVGMTERAHLVGGTLFAAPDGRMFVVRAELPVTGYARDGAVGGREAAE